MLNHAQTPSASPSIALPDESPSHTVYTEGMTEPLAGVSPTTHTLGKPEVHYLYVWETGDSIPMSSPTLTPEAEQQAGQQAGRAEARRLLDQAERDKGKALTKGDVRKVYLARFASRMQEYDQGELTRPWFDGWCQGFVSACIQAEDAAPDAPVPVIATAAVSRTEVKFRQATLDVDDPKEFFDGVLCGQMCAVDERKPLTGERLFALFEDAMRDDEASETWLAGYLLSLADAICRNRKQHPRK